MSKYREGFISKEISFALRMLGFDYTSHEVRNYAKMFPGVFLTHNPRPGRPYLIPKKSKKRFKELIRRMDLPVKTDDLINILDEL